MLQERQRSQNNTEIHTSAYFYTYQYVNDTINVLICVKESESALLLITTTKSVLGDRKGAAVLS